MVPLSVSARRALLPVVIGASQVGGTSVGSVGPDCDDTAGCPASARLFATATDASSVVVINPTLIPAANATLSRRRRRTPGSITRRVRPSAEKSDVPKMARAQGYPASSEGTSVWRPRSTIWRQRPARDGRRIRPVPIARAAMMRNVFWPWAAGGHANEAAEIPTGSSSAIPTRRSAGPPGR